MADGPKNVASVHRLTPTQEGILFHASAAGADAAVYVQQFSATLVTSGALDEARFERAWQAVVDRHPALRTQLNWRKREDPLQVVRASVDAPVRWLADADDFAAFVEADRAVPVDLERAPAHRVAVQRDERGARLLWTFHHALLDGWSMRLVLTDLCAAYGGAVLAPAPATHGAYVDWLLERQRAPDAALAFWRDALAGVDERCTLAWPDAGGAPATLSRALDAEATRALGEFARTRRATLSSVLRVAWAAVLARHVGTRDVVFGTTVSGRSAPVTGIETGVGMFVSTIPVRVRLGGTVERLLAAAQADAVDAVEHEWLPLATIQSEASDVEEGELFDALLVVENHAEEADPEGAALRLVDRRFVEQSHYGVALLAVPGEQLELACVVDGAVADARGAARLAEDTLRVLRALPSMGPGATADDLLDAATDAWDGKRAAAASLGPAAREEPAVDVLGAVEAAARTAPDAPALVSSDDEVSYAELLARADGFAAWLGAESVSAGETVLLALPRGPDAICAMLGCLRAGVVYAPVAHDAGAEHVERMRTAAGARLVVRACTRVEGTPPRGSTDADALAYVLFTSGTTGEPKGVEITRGALARSNRARFDHYGAGPGAFLLVSPLHFDSSVAGIWWTLAAGGAL
ncbi:MAG: condensation domain-containing protein, partial [Planctomycetota bacterium]